MPTFNGFKLEGSFPAVITPDHKQPNYNEFIQNIQQNREQIHQLLLKHGALLFRGFPVNGAADFSTVIETLALGNFVNYIGGDSPRDAVTKKVYTSTEAPASLLIPLHQELSFVKNHPHNIYFHCEIASPVRGATIIGDARRILNAIDPAVRKRFEEKGITYTSRYFRKSKLIEALNRYQRSHKSWMEVFETTEKAEVEARCKQSDFTYKWLQNDWIEIQQKRPALTVHAKTKETIWFNQAHMYDFNPKFLGWKNYLGTKLLYNKNTLLHEVAFGDGSPIPRKDLYHILDVLNANTVAYPWQKGDVMVLDNVLAMHGRDTFSGKRRVLTALTA